jgi:hypothetical protein
MRRRNPSSLKKPDHDLEPLDEDEQEKVVNELEREASSQIGEMRQIFGGICLIASVGCLVLSIFTASETTVKIHGIYSSVVHFLAFRLSTLPSNCTSALWKNERLLIALILVPISLLLLWFDKSALDTDLHWSLSICNLLTGLGSIFVGREARNTGKQISDLHASKYRFKSL